MSVRGSNGEVNGVWQGNLVFVVFVLVNAELILLVAEIKWVLLFS